MESVDPQVHLCPRGVSIPLPGIIKWKATSPVFTENTVDSFNPVAGNH